MDLIKIDYSNNSVNARDVYAFIFEGQKKKTAFNVWISRVIERYKFVEGKDYTIGKNDVAFGRPSIKCILSKEASHIIIQAHEFSAKVLRANRKELIFIDMLNPILINSELVNRILYQYPIKNYRVDIYLPEYKLAIEYDEKHHREGPDKIREDAINKEIPAIRFFRVKEGKELESIGRIIKTLLDMGKQYADIKDYISPLFRDKEPV